MTFLTPHHISLTLRAICYGRPLPTTPLFRLKSIPFDMHNTISNEIAMTDWLVSLICQQLNYQRTIHHLSPLTPTTTKEETEVSITQAYVINAPYLQAWMVLYARVVRTDLTFTPDTLDEAKDSKMPLGATNTCVFVPTTKRDKSPAHRPPQEYIIPTIGRLLDLFNMKSKGADPITLNDIQSVKTYRSALNRELIRRRAGKYSQAWLAERLSVCVRTLQRYIKLDGIHCQQILYATDITPDNIYQIPPKSLARRAGITIQYCFLQDVTGKRYPPIQAIARKLLRQGIPAQWMRRGWNLYWIGDETTQSHVVFVPDIEHCYHSVSR